MRVRGLLQQFLHSLDSPLDHAITLGTTIVLCSNLYELANAANSLLENCGPLSLLTISGIPCRTKQDFRMEITELAVVDVNFTTSGYREK